MARTRVSPEGPGGEVLDPFPDDDIQDAEQAEVGSLFSIQGQQFENVSWSIHRYRTRAEMAGEPTANRKEWVLDVQGELRGAELLPAIGGGDFQFLGYIPRDDGRGVRLKYNRSITLAGPRKNFTLAAPVDPTAAPVTPIAAPVSNSTDELLRELIRQQQASRDDRFMKLLEALTERPAEKSAGIAELVTALEGLHRLSGGGAPREQTPLEVAKMVLDGFHQGVTIGQEREPVSVREGDGPNYMPVVEKGLEILQAMLARRPIPRPPGAPPAAGGAPPPPPPPPQHEPSSASVVEEPVKPPTGTPEYRWATAVEAMYRAMSNGRDPADFASSLEDMLAEPELALIRDGNPTVDQVLDYLAPIVSQYPALSTAQGKTYVTSVLAAVHAAPEDDS